MGFHNFMVTALDSSVKWPLMGDLELYGGRELLSTRVPLVHPT